MTTVDAPVRVRRLPDEPPAWVRGYIDIPFSDRGRDRRGVDCWGLVRLLYAEQFDVLLPSYAEEYLDTADREAIAEIFSQDAGEAGPWIDVEPEQRRVGDLAVFRIGRDERHVGIIVDRARMLHSHRGVDSCLERMDSVVWAPRLARSLTYAGPVRIRGLQEPHRGGLINVTLPAGLSIAELLAAAGVEASPFLHVYLGDLEVPAEAWPRVRPRPGRQLIVAAVPQGGGKDVARVVAIIAIAVAAAVIGQYWVAPALGGGAIGTAGAAVFGAAFTIAGSLAVNALIPPPKQRLTQAGGDDATTSPALTGSRNTARPYQVVPVVLGGFRYSPPYGALPYTEIVGDDQYLRCLFVLGQGPLDASAFRLGATPLEQFEGVELEIRRGFDGEAPLSLYPSLVHEDGVSTLLSQASSWQTRVSQADARELSVDVSWLNGLVQLDAAGNKLPRTVSIEVQYRAVGATDWLDINGNASDTTGSPLDYRQMDLLFREPEVQPLSNGTFAADLAWSADGSLPGTKPAYLPPDHFSWMVEGYINIGAFGANFEFGVDSSDAADVHIDGQAAADWYGNHPPMGAAGVPDFTPAPGKINRTIFLGPGLHTIRARVECRRTAGPGAGGAVAVGIRQQGGAWSVVKLADMRLTVFGTGPGLNYAAFSTANYLSTITATEARTSTVRRNLTWAVLPGQYEVRLRRITPDSTSTSIVDVVYWTALRTITGKDPVQIPNCARIALRIKASGQLSGVVDDFNCFVQSILPSYDAAQFGTWIQKATSNPADLYRAILQGRGNKRPLPDDRVSLTDLADWHVACDINGWTFNGVIDFAGTVRERLADVAAAGRASPGMRDGLHTVVRDVPQTVPRQHFTPRNSFGFQGVKTFPDLPHALRCKFPNQEADYEQDERVVLNDGYQLPDKDGVPRDAFGNVRPDLPPATKFETFEMFGITDPAAVFKHARYHLAVAILRPETYTIGTDFEHLACNRGDMVLLTHDVMLVGLASGRVLNLVTNAAAELAGLVLDETVVMEAGKEYGLRIRLQDGTSFRRTLVTTPGASQEVIFTSPVAPGDPWPAIGDLFSYGESGRETIEAVVKSIEITKDLAATLVLVDHSPAIHQADQGEIPPFDSGITQPPDYSNRPDPPIIENIRSDESVMIRDADGSLRNRMVITLRRVSGTRPIPTDAQVRTRIHGSQGAWVYHPVVPIQGGEVSVSDVDQGVTYDIAIRVITAAGAASDWTYAIHTVVGKSSNPPDVLAFDVVRLPDGERQYSWDLGTEPPDTAGVLIRYGATGLLWENLTPLQSDPIQATPWLSPDPPAGTWRFGIKQVDTSGNESTDALYIERTLGQPPLDGIAFLEDAGLAGWPGVKTDCHRAQSGNVLEADDNATWGTLAAYGITQWSQWSRWVVSPKSPIAYEHTVVDAGVVFEFTPDAIATADGALVVEASWSADGTTYTNWLEISQARLQSVTARYLKIRASVAATTVYPVPVLRTLVALMRAQTVVQEIQDFVTATADSAHRVGVGDVRLPAAAGAFKLIRTVQLTFNGMGAGWSWELVDRDAILGPRVRMYNSDHQLADATVDAVIRGL